MAMTCIYCKKDLPLNSRANKRFCDWRCTNAWNTEQREPKDCPECGITFLPTKPKTVYCSPSCWLTFYNRTDREHSVAGGIAGGAAIIAMYRGTGKGYIKVNGRHEHRIVAEEKLGRPLEPGEIVHHDDENKKNNDPGNLEVTTQSEHIKIHHPKMLAARKEKHGW